MVFKTSGAIAGAPPFASFASLRISENRRLSEEANLSQRRKGAAIDRWMFYRVVCRIEQVRSGLTLMPLIDCLGYGE